MVLAAMPDRAYRVDDVACLELVALGDFRHSRRATAERLALFEQLLAGRAMDGAVHAAAAEQGRVRRVHNRVHRLFRDVAFDDFDPVLDALGTITDSIAFGQPLLRVAMVW